MQFSKYLEMEDSADEREKRAKCIRNRTEAQKDCATSRTIR